MRVPFPDAQDGNFLPALIPSVMRHDREIEFIPLDCFGKESPKKRGFLSRLLRRVARWIVNYSKSESASSSGGEVAERIIEF